MAFKKVNFQLVTPYLNLDVRDFDVDFAGNSMPADILPNTDKALIDGEWMMLSAGGKKVTRGFNADLSTPVGVPCFPLYAEKGRTELMALSKVPVIWMGSFEADTHLYKSSDSAMALGARLVVMGVNKAGGIDGTELGTALIHSVVAANAYAADPTTNGHTVGFVTRTKAANGSRGIRIYCSLGLGL